VVITLAQNGADIDCQHYGGRTPLSSAAEKGDYIIVRSLVRLGADIDLKDNTGLTPLDYAIENGHIDVAKEMSQALKSRANGNWITREEQQYFLWPTDSILLPPHVQTPKKDSRRRSL
jgi:ankyrin repeat protein